MRLFRAIRLVAHSLLQRAPTTLGQFDLKTFAFPPPSPFVRFLRVYVFLLVHLSLGGAHWPIPSFLSLSENGTFEHLSEVPCFISIFLTFCCALTRNFAPGPIVAEVFTRIYFSQN